MCERCVYIAHYSDLNKSNDNCSAQVDYHYEPGLHGFYCYRVIRLDKHCQALFIKLFIHVANN